MSCLYCFVRRSAERERERESDESDHGGRREKENLGGFGSGNVFGSSSVLEALDHRLFFFF